MTLQAVRNHFEAPLRAAAAALTPPVAVYGDNQIVEAKDEYIKIRTSFGLTTEAMLTGNAENLRGSMAIEVFTRKGDGPGRGQRIATALMQALNQITATRHAEVTVRGSIREVTGPTQLELDNRPQLLTRIGCGLQATYTGPQA